MEQQQQQQQQKMRSPSQQDAPSTAALEEKEEVYKTNEEIAPSSAAAEAQDSELCCLSGDKPFFDIILSKSHASPHYSMKLPPRAVKNLPSGCARVVIRRGDRKWDLWYNGSEKRPKFHYPADWKKFVDDNNLKPGDACIFEVMESSPTSVELKAVFLRNTKCLPPQLLAEVEHCGRIEETAIEPV